MAPKLYSSKFSPVARAVEMCAQAIGLKLDVVYFNLDGDHLKSDLAKINPKHTVPTLDDNGFYLWDSHAIMIYLVEKYGKGNNVLYPGDIRSRALVNQRLFFDCGDLFAEHRANIGPLFFGKVSELTDEAIKSVAQNYPVVEHFLQNNKFVAGDVLTIADFSIWCTITNASTYSTLDESKYPNIKAWRRRMELLPYASINIEGGKAFGNLVQSLLKK